MSLWEAPVGSVPNFGKNPAPEQPDMVAHPPHYTGYKGFEVIDIVEQLDYLRGTAVKYIMRAGHKWNAAEDIDKAIWYLTRYSEKLKSGLDTDVPSV